MSKSKTADVPAVQADNTALVSQAANPYAEDAGAGLEELSSDEISIPWLVLLQSNSPEVAGQHPLPGAAKGKFFHRSTQELYDNLGVILAHQTVEWVEWVPHDQGGGLVARYQPTDPVVIDTVRSQGKFGKLALTNGNILKKTIVLYMVIVGEDNEPIDEVAFACSGAKLSTMGKIDGAMKRYCTTQKCPAFAIKWTLSSYNDTNKKGQAYANIRLTPAGGAMSASLVPPSSLAYASAKALWGSIRSGEKAADLAKSDGVDADDYPEQDRMEGDDPLV